MHKDGYMDLKEIDVFRVRLGLREIKRGVVVCLRCRRKFTSSDKSRNRLCIPCSIQNKQNDYNPISISNI